MTTEAEPSGPTRTMLLATPTSPLEEVGSVSDNDLGSVSSSWALLLQLKIGDIFIEFSKYNYVFGSYYMYLITKYNVM